MANWNEKSKHNAAHAFRNWINEASKWKWSRLDWVKIAHWGKRRYCIANIWFGEHVNVRLIWITSCNGNLLTLNWNYDKVSRERARQRGKQMENRENCWRVSIFSSNQKHLDFVIGKMAMTTRTRQMLPIRTHGYACNANAKWKMKK